MNQSDSKALWLALASLTVLAVAAFILAVAAPAAHGAAAVAGVSRG